MLLISFPLITSIRFLYNYFLILDCNKEWPSKIDLQNIFIQRSDFIKDKKYWRHSKISLTFSRFYPISFFNFILSGFSCVKMAS